MSENHHALAAGSILSGDKAWTVGWETADAQHVAAHIEATVEATLALAYEQRTANLIAMYTDGNTGTAPGVNYKDLLEAITERLDLA